MARSDKIPGLNSLCSPAYLYFILSIVLLIIAGIYMNTDDMKHYCVGRCNPVQVILFFLIKLIFIIFWTWILNVLCRGGAGWLSWLMVLFPFIMIFAVVLTTFGGILSNIGQYKINTQNLPMQPGQPIIVNGPVMNMPQPMMGQTQPMLVNGMPAPKM